MPLSVATVHEGIVMAASLFGEHRKQVAAVLLSLLFRHLFRHYFLAHISSPAMISP